jgi:hypothetical protein
MTTATTSPFALSIAENAEILLSYAEALLKGVPASQAAVRPAQSTVNHPVWILGHLSVYPDKGVLPMLGREDLVRPFDDYEAMFSAKGECQDDPEQTIYPPLEEVQERYFDRTRAALVALREASDETLAKPAAESPFGDSITHTGGLINFLLIAHTSMHYGQISAWRRLMGLGPCM